MPRAGGHLRAHRARNDVYQPDRGDVCAICDGYVMRSARIRNAASGTVEQGFPGQVDAQAQAAGHGGLGAHGAHPDFGSHRHQRA
jgi:hypothetical protein